MCWGAPSAIRTRITARRAVSRPSFPDANSPGAIWRLPASHERRSTCGRAGDASVPVRGLRWKDQLRVSRPSDAWECRPPPEKIARAQRLAAERPWLASANTQPKRTPAAMTRSISSIASSGCIWAAGIARARLDHRGPRRSSSFPAATAAGSACPAPSDASVTDTSVWQLTFLPNSEAY